MCLRGGVIRGCVCFVFRFLSSFFTRVWPELAVFFLYLCVRSWLFVLVFILLLGVSCCRSLAFFLL